MLIAIITLLLCTCSKATATDIVESKKISSEELNITSSSDKVEDGEEFNIAIDLEESIAAYTLWVYFDSDKVECISEIDNLNIVENKLIYTWFSETGRNQKLEHLAQIDFKSKEDGVAAFSVIGEFYNEKGEEIQVNSDSVDVKIGEESITSMSEIVSVDDSKNNAKLDIMRLGIEGITPDFSPDVNEYYLIVDENVKDIDVTAIPQNTKANVRITGNKNLKNGLNKIEIDVTSEDKSEKNKYTINVTKTSNEQNANADLETLAIENYVLRWGIKGSKWYNGEWIFYKETAEEKPLPAEARAEEAIEAHLTENLREEAETAGPPRAAVPAAPTAIGAEATEGNKGRITG